jgi:hypothetical protein
MLIASLNVSQVSKKKKKNLKKYHWCDDECPPMHHLVILSIGWVAIFHPTPHLMLTNIVS